MSEPWHSIYALVNINVADKMGVHPPHPFLWQWKKNTHILQPSMWSSSIQLAHWCQVGYFTFWMFHSFWTKHEPLVHPSGQWDPQSSVGWCGTAGLHPHMWQWCLSSGQRTEDTSCGSRPVADSNDKTIKEQSRAQRKTQLRKLWYTVYEFYSFVVTIPRFTLKFPNDFN